MNLAIEDKEIEELLFRQLQSFFMLKENEKGFLSKIRLEALKRTAYCFSKTENKYYSDKNGEPFFNPFHSGQYTIFLYYLSNSIFRTGQNSNLADRVYYLNRTLNSCDLFYEVELPEVFMLDHPVGSVMGRATYGNYFSFTQNCTVGQNKETYPEIGDHVTMFSGSKIVGNCKIGDQVLVSANTYIKDSNIPSNSIVFGSSPNLTIKER